MDSKSIKLVDFNYDGRSEGSVHFWVGVGPQPSAKGQQVWRHFIPFCIIILNGFVSVWIHLVFIMQLCDLSKVTLTFFSRFLTNLDISNPFVSTLTRTLSSHFRASWRSSTSVGSVSTTRPIRKILVILSFQVSAFICSSFQKGWYVLHIRQKQIWTFNQKCARYTNLLLWIAT